MSKIRRIGSDRGLFHGYRIVAACSIIQAINLGGIFTFGVLFPELEREFGWSRAAISGATSFSFLMIGGGAVFMGQAVDRFGPRAVVTLAGIIFGLGYGLLFRMQAVWELYLYVGLLAGIGLAAHDVSTLSTIARWFVRRRGLMSGITKAGGGGGQVIVPTFMAAMIAGPGWRIACLAFGITAIVVLVGAAQTLRRSPASLGLKPDDETPDPATNPAQQEDGATFRQALGSKALWLLCIAKFCDLFCLFTIIVHIVSFGVDRGLHPAIAAGVLSTIGAMSIAGRLVLGGAYDLFGARRSLLACFSLLTASLMWLQFADTTWSLFLFAAIYGPAHGGFFTVTSPSVAEFFGTRAHGTLFGLVIFCGTFGATLGPIVAGSLFDVWGSYTVAFALLLGFSLTGLAVASMLPRSVQTSGALEP